MIVTQDDIDKGLNSFILQYQGIKTIDKPYVLKLENMTANDTYRYNNLMGTINVESFGNKTIKFWLAKNPSAYVDYNGFDNIKTIGEYCFIFSDRTNFKGIEDSASIKTISNAAFCACMQLTSFKAPVNLEIIKTLAFCGCSRLEEVTLPASIQHIGKNAFSVCQSLKAIRFKGKTRRQIQNMECFGEWTDNHNVIYIPELLEDNSVNPEFWSLNESAGFKFNSTQSFNVFSKSPYDDDDEESWFDKVLDAVQDVVSDLTGGGEIAVSSGSAGWHDQWNSPNNTDWDRPSGQGGGGIVIKWTF